MDKLKINKSILNGKVEISGAKNSALKLLAASLLTQSDIEIHNFPTSIIDAQIQINMLINLGKSIQVENKSIFIKENQRLKTYLKWEGHSIRTTLLIFGALLARFGEAKVPLPGGCRIGERKYDLHIMLLKSLGAHIWEEDTYLCGSVDRGLFGTDIILPLRSTGATENAVISGSLSHGITTVWNPHIRPEVLDLINFLRKMGANISVRGNESIRIEGSSELQGARHSVIPDNMEALTYFIASVITKGDVEIVNFPFQHLEIPLIHLRESGASFYKGIDSVIVRGGECYPIEISTGPYPGINSDMQPLFAVYALSSNGQSKITDLRFPDRYGYANELKKMKADLSISDNRLLIKGVNKLIGANVTALDLRCGAALILAGLIAQGETVIDNFDQVQRGYEEIVSKFKKLNAEISVIH